MTKKQRIISQACLTLSVVVGLLCLMPGGVLQDGVEGLFARKLVFVGDHPETRDMKGVVLRGKWVDGPYHEYTFRLYNLTPSRLTVTAKPTCGCINGSWTRHALPPFSVTAYRATIAQDPVGKVVLFQSNRSNVGNLYGFFDPQ